MALRFWNEHQSRYTDGGATWRIEIWDSSFVGEEYEFKVANGVRKEYRADGDNVFSPILGSSVTFQMEVEDTTHEALITDLAGAPEGRFTVALYVDTVFDWAGVINSPEISIEDHTYSYGFSITAVDGLALLKNYEYRQAGTDTTKWDLRYTGIDKLSDIVFRCLQKLPHVVTHFTGSTKFLVSAVNWYAEQHDATPVAADYDPLYYTEIDNRFAASGQSSGNAKFLSCYEVLHHILRPFGARIGLFDGYFLIEQVEHRNYAIGSNDNYSRYYAYDGTGPTANTLTADQDMGLAEAIKPLGGTYSFERPVFSSRVTQNVNSLQNLLAGAYMDSGTVETVTVENVFADGASSYIRFTGNLEWSFENLGVGAPGDIIFIARFRLKMLFDAKYAVRTVVYDNYGGWTVTSVSWSGSLGYIEIPIVVTVPALTETWTGQTKVDFLFPNASDFTQGDTEFSLEFIEINYYTLGAETLLDPSDYELDWTLRDPYCGIVLNPKKIKLLGLPPGVANPKTVTYEVFGGSTNTQTEQIDTYIGDKAGTVTNQWGGLLFDNAGTYEYTELWGARNGTREWPLAQLLAKRTVEFYYYPKKIFRGTIVGTTIVPQTPITYDGTTYFLKSGSLQTDRAEFTGEWVEIDYSVAELTYGPVEYDTGEYEKSSAGGGGSGGGGGNPDNGGAGSGSGSGSGTGANIYNSDGAIPASTTRTVNLSASDSILVVTDEDDAEVAHFEKAYSQLESGGFYIYAEAGNGAVMSATGNNVVVSPTGILAEGAFSASKTSASPGDNHSLTIDDGSNSNLVRTQASVGVLLQSTGDSIQIEGVTRLTDIITSASLGADQNDYAGFDGANVGRVTASTAINITGIDSGADGRILAIHNVGSNPVTLVNGSTSSAADNRFDIGEDYTIRASHGCLLQYDNTSKKWRIIAADRLGRFTEAYTTSTATTASLTATSPATNVNLAIVPKGTGGVIAAVAEGTSAGGNARGNYAVDLQTQRTNATDVASGANATIPGGRRCTASGAYSFATGFRGTASGAGSVAFGGSGGFSVGATASGSNSFAFGNSGNATAANAIGFNATASAQSAFALGRDADKQFMFSTYPVAFLKWQNDGVIGTATVEMFLDGASLTATVPSNERWQFEIAVFALTVSVGDGSGTIGHQYCASYTGVIRNITGTTSFLGSVDALMAAKSDATMADASFTITADDTGDYLKVEFNPPSTAGSISQYTVGASAKLFIF